MSLHIEIDDKFYILPTYLYPRAKEMCYEHRDDNGLFVDVLNGSLSATEHSQTEADCRAKMWLYLKQHQLLGA